MKAIKSLFLAVALVAGMGNVYAQDEEIDETFQFVDKNGNVVPNGSEITVNEVEWAVPGVLCEIKTDLKVKNTSANEEYASMEFDVDELPNGRLDCCFPVTCSSVNETGKGYDTQVGSVLAGDTKDMQTEWYPTVNQYGTAKVTFRIKVYVHFGLTNTFVGYGPSVTVNFVYADPAGINGVTADDNAAETARYTIGGRKLTQPEKGINVVRKADGTVKKVLVK